MPTPAVQHVPIGSIKPNPSNPRTIRDERFHKLVQSIKDFPEMLELRPIVTDADRVVLGGNMRLKACKAAGLKTVPVVVADHLTESQRREFIVKDNVGFGDWDWDALANEWDAGELEAWGLDVPEVEQEPTTGLTDADDVPKPPKEPITKPGDIIRLGRHTIICGDCRDFATVDRLLNGAKIQLAVTSPPYASQRTYDESSGFKPIPAEEYVGWYRDVAVNIMAHLAADGSYFCNIKAHVEDGQRTLYVLDLVLSHVREWGWRLVDELCWLRTGVPGHPEKMGGRFKNGFEPVYHFTAAKGHKMRPEAVAHDTENAIDYAAHDIKGARVGKNGVRGDLPVTGAGRAFPPNVLELKGNPRVEGHSAAYPVALPAFFVKAYTDVGDAVYDPFIGSGTTLIAAEMHERAAFGCEISPAYCDVIVRRWEEFTGQKAIRQTSTNREDTGNADAAAAVA
jgi:hypothetical protein